MAKREQDRIKDSYPKCILRTLNQAIDLSVDDWARTMEEPPYVDVWSNYAADDDYVVQKYDLIYWREDLMMSEAAIKHRKDIAELLFCVPSRYDNPNIPKYLYVNPVGQRCSKTPIEGGIKYYRDDLILS